ncbi:MoaD/ThiS family protein [Seonamhaeicola sp. NFXS20]|uniref:MoaD/ThiS family protein n=1 Tax=unclassified Seonamhaeicola TaxID=2622645 RepID=UPI0035643618
MLITVKYFGQIAEVTHKSEETLNVEGTKISDVLKLLNEKYKDLKHKDFQLAQNQELVTKETKLTGDELALLPPFAGG